MFSAKTPRFLTLLLAAAMALSLAGCARDTTVVLTVSKDGAAKEYTLTQLKALGTVSGKGGSMSSTGKISGPNDIKGVPVDAVLKGLGGMEEGKAIRVEAKDGYSMTVSEKQIAADEFTCFNSVTKQEASHGDLTMLLIFEENGKALDEGAGPLRLGIVSDEGTVTEGHWWVKWVTKIDVIDYVEPWTLDLKGRSTRSLDNDAFAQGAGTSFSDWTDADGRVWRGISVKYLIGLVDDDDPNTFNTQLAQSGYKIEFKAADGFTRVLESAKLLDADWIVAHMRDGAAVPENQWPLRLVGTGLSKGEMVGQLTTVTIIS
jgi:DMSO/TMAO reductase YedYZ molybdopterin-dependent catalytic subunit